MIRTVTVILLLMLFLPGISTAQENSFLRFVPAAEQWRGELQTSISRYQNADGQLVELVAAVHIGDLDYYETLNRHFDTLDLVLFELVTDDEDFANGDASAGNYSALGFIQNLMGEFLQLEFQLAAIDYARAHFQRADLSARELSQIMESKNESFFSMFMSMAMAQIAAEQNAVANRDIEPSTLSLLSLITALSSDNQAQALKFLLAQEMGRSGDLALSPVLESQLTILGDRNLVVLDALQQALRQRTQLTGLFYGAAHMPGIERELVQTMGFKLISRNWITAWAIP